MVISAYRTGGHLSLGSIFKSLESASQCNCRLRYKRGSDVLKIYILGMWLFFFPTFSFLLYAMFQYFFFDCFTFEMKDNCQLLVNVDVLSTSWPLGRPGPARGRCE